MMQGTNHKINTVFTIFRIVETENRNTGRQRPQNNLNDIRIRYEFFSNRERQMLRNFRKMSHTSLDEFAFNAIPFRLIAKQRVQVRQRLIKYVFN